MAARRAHNPEAVGSSPTSATISQTSLSQDSEVSFYVERLIGFTGADLHQPVPIVPCLAVFGNFPRRHLVGTRSARKPNQMIEKKTF